MGAYEPTLTAVGEKGFLTGLLPQLYADPRLLGGFGHDAAIITLDGAPFNLIQKIDRASYPVSLRYGWSGYQSWGQMAVTANCSDILASGGRPVSCMPSHSPSDVTPEPRQTRPRAVHAAREPR